MTDERLLRYVDGELDPAEIVDFEAGMAADPALRSLVERHLALRASAARAFDAVLAEPVPARLLAALEPSTNVVDIASARPRRRWDTGFVQRCGTLAATFVIGIVAGQALEPGRLPLLSADAELARALDGGAVAGLATAISYRDQRGDYCRVFRDRRQEPAAGVACREAKGWTIRVLASDPGDPATAYRTASAALPPAVLATVDASIKGAPFDAPEEAAAARRGWRGD